MSRTRHLAMVASVVAVAAPSLLGCGGGSKAVSGSSTSSSGSSSVSSGGSAGSAAVANVGGVPITKAAVSHWMGTLAGGDYYELSPGHTIPEGLVSEPPNYGKCVAKLEEAAASAPKSSLKTTGVTLLTKCRQLYQALRGQAVEFLVKAQWLVDVYRDLGVTASDAEVATFFTKYRAERFPTEAQLQDYLAKRRLSLSDQMLVLKLDFLSQKAMQKFSTDAQQAQAKFLATSQRWTEKTNCSPGYVVEHCKQYAGGGNYSAGPSPAVLVEQVAAIATGHCTAGVCPK